jgi:hypothetical protein
MAEKDIDRLFEVPPGEFVSARDDLVRSLKENGHDDLATEVKAFRKPTLPAWALNQLVRRRSDDVEAFLEAGQELRKVQRRGDPAGLRRATQRRRQLMAGLMGAAGEIVGEQGAMTDASRRAIEDTLETASSDPGSGQQLLRGRLTRPLERGTGFEALGGLTAVPGKGEGEPDAAGEDRAEERLRHALEDARRRLEDAEKELRGAEMRAKTLAAEAERMTARAREAREGIEAKKAARAEAKRRVQKAERALARTVRA